MKENASDICHGVLDVAGFIPAVGAVPDLINAGIYALEGNGLEAGLSLAAAVPVVGDISAGVGKGGKWLCKAGKWLSKTKVGKKIVPKLLNALEKCKFLVGRFANYCKNKWGKIKTGAKGFFNGGKNFFKKQFDKIKKWFKKIKNKFKKKRSSEAKLPEQAGRGQSRGGRHEPANLKEKLAMEEAMTNPKNGRELVGKNTDPRWPAEEGWKKYTQNVNGHEIHYEYNPLTGQIDDVKLK